MTMIQVRPENDPMFFYSTENESIECIVSIDVLGEDYSKRIYYLTGKWNNDYENKGSE